MSSNNISLYKMRKHKVIIKDGKHSTIYQGQLFSGEVSELTNDFNEVN